MFASTGIVRCHRSEANFAEIACQHPIKLSSNGKKAFTSCWYLLVSIRPGIRLDDANFIGIKEYDMKAASQKANKVTVKKQRTVSVKQAKVAKPADAADDLKYISRNDLEVEVLKLRQAVAAMERAETVDRVSGLANRAKFLDLANAEFARCRRYDHNMTLVVTDIVGLDQVFSRHGSEAADQVVMSVSQMCYGASRMGVDILGRLSDNQVAIMLPETALAGGMKCIDRLRKLITSTPIVLESGEQIKPGMKVSVDTLIDTDQNFTELFGRTTKHTPTKRFVHKNAA